MCGKSPSRLSVCQWAESLELHDAGGRHVGRGGLAGRQRLSCRLVSRPRFNKALTHWTRTIEPRMVQRSFVIRDLHLLVESSLRGLAESHARGGYGWGALGGDA
jgi:hypothetical protein